MITSASRGILVGAALLAVTGLGGCATKKYVAEQISPVQSQIAATDAKIAGVDATAREALQRADAAGKLAEGKFVYSTVLSDDSVKFPGRTATLTDEAKTRLDAFADRLRSENRNVYVEIQGHTDATRSKDADYRLGQQRAEAVRRYLHSKGVALNRIGTISYGSDVPAVPDATPAARQANRRVVLVVMS
jgi:outer membrane protein OmpA-like peptidoglycan-associated protein